MRKTLLMSAAGLAIAFAAPAFAQSNDTNGETTPPARLRAGHTPGVGNSEPGSSRASNIDHADTRSDIAPRLPNPHVGDNGTPEQYLGDAKKALGGHRTGEAQEALERAQTRLLDRSVPAGQTTTPISDPRVAMVEEARQALGHGDAKKADMLVGQAMASNDGGAADASGGQTSPYKNLPPESALPGSPPVKAPYKGLSGTHSYQPGGAGDAGSTGTLIR